MLEILKKLDELTISGLQRKQRSINRLFPTFPDRVKAIGGRGGLRLRDTDEDSWHFKVHSGTQTGVWYDCVLYFKNIPITLEQLIKDRRLWVADKSRADLKKVAKRFLEVVDIQAYCSCPAFQYWGPAYILSLSKYDAKYTDRETRPPRIRNPKQYGAYCKHYENVMKVLPFYKTTVAKWLKDFYSDEIRRFEEEAREEFGWAKRAAVALRRRKEEEEPEEEE